MVPYCISAARWNNLLRVKDNRHAVWHSGLQLRSFWWMGEQSEVGMNKLTSLWWYVCAQHVTGSFVAATCWLWVCATEFLWFHVYDCMCGCFSFTVNLKLKLFISHQAITFVCFGTKIHAIMEKKNHPAEHLHGINSSNINMCDCQWVVKLTERQNWFCWS